jgi:type I restriction enzyme S subunit
MSFTANIDEVVAENRNHLLGSHPKWERVRLKEVATILNGYPFESHRFKKSGGTPLVRIRDILDGRTETFYDGDFDSTFLVKRGEILIGMDGDFHCEPWTGEPALLNQRVCKITPDESRYAKQFLRYLLPGYLRAINEQTPSVTVKHLSSRTIAEIPLPLPPLPEQRRIVTEIEKQFTRLEAGVAALRRVQANLKRYRAAVLKAACEGKLVPTEAELQKSEGRAQKSKTKFETGAELLARILTERRKNWQGRGKYKEPAAPDTANLPSLPGGWVWATLDSLIREPLRNGHSAKATGTETGLRVFTLSAVTEGDFSERNTKLSVATAEKVAGLWAEPGDIYVERSNTPELVGIARHYKGVPHFAFIPDLFIRVRMASPVPVSYIEMCLLSERGRTFFRSRAQGISGTMPKIDQETVELAPIPLPPLPEQTRIVAEVERRLSMVDELESVVSANLHRAARLRQSILQKAFTGELVMPETVPDVQLGLPGIASNVIDMGNLLQNRAALDAYILIHSAHDKYLGRTKMEKGNHFVEFEAEINLCRNAIRDAAGPVDFSSRLAVEAEAKKLNWYSVVKHEIGAGRFRYEYVACKDISAAIPIAEKFMGDRKSAVDRLIKLLKPLDTDKCSIVATVFAAWNDLQLLGRPISDQAIIKESTDNWHPEKKKISLHDWNWGLNWLRDNQVFPKGRGKTIPPKK